MDITFITTPLLQIGGAVFAASLPVVLLRVWRLVGLQNNAAAQQMALDLAKQAAGMIYHDLVVRNQSLTNVQVHSRALNDALTWLRNEAPQGRAILQKAGWDNQHITDALTAQIGHLLSVDPSVSVTPQPTKEAVDMTKPPATGMMPGSVSGMPARLGALLMIGLVATGLAACSAPASNGGPAVTPPAHVMTMADLQSVALPILADVLSEAEALQTSGVIPAKYQSDAQVAIATLQQAEIALKNPIAGSDARSIALDVVNGLNGVLAVVPLPPNVKLASALVLGVAGAVANGLPSSVVMPPAPVVKQ